MKRRDIRVIYMTIVFIIGLRFLFSNLGFDIRKFDIFLILWAIVIATFDKFTQILHLED